MSVELGQGRTTMSEQEWRDAIEAGLLRGDCGDENDPARYLDGVVDAIAPLRAKDRQDALTEAADVAAEMRGAPSPGSADPFAQGWRAGLHAAQTVLSARAAAAGAVS